MQIVSHTSERIMKELHREAVEREAAEQEEGEDNALL